MKEAITAVRVSGKLQTWKTRPEDFRLPVKYGMYESSEIVPYNAADFHVADDCEIVTVYPDGRKVIDMGTVTVDDGDEFNPGI